jgi:hypothetical protein
MTLCPIVSLTRLPVIIVTFAGRGRQGTYLRAVSFITEVSRSGHCRRFLLGDCVTLVLHPRSLDK